MKFSIRDVMLVTVIVALVLGWGLDRVASWVHQDALQADIVRLSAEMENLRRLESIEITLKRHEDKDLDWRVEFLTSQLRTIGKEYDFGKPGGSAVTIIETLPDGSKKRTTKRYER